jgi:hypothetical protein
MEEWQIAIIKTEEHLRNMSDDLKCLATKTDVDTLSVLMKMGQKEIISSRPKNNGMKDRILLILTIVICSIAAGTSAVALAMKVVGG